MLIIFLIWIIATVTCFLLGHFTLNLLKRVFNSEGLLSIHFTTYFMMGCVVLGFLISAFSLFMKIALAANLIVFLIAILILAFDFKKISQLFKVYFQELKHIHFS